LTIDFGARRSRFRGSVRVVTFGSEQYRWGGRGAKDLPNPDAGLKLMTAPGGATTYTIPPQSITVLRGTIP
jgi:hypothetical protein